MKDYFVKYRLILIFYKKLASNMPFYYSFWLSRSLLTSISPLLSLLLLETKKKKNIELGRILTREIKRERKRTRRRKDHRNQRVCVLKKKLYWVEFRLEYIGANFKLVFDLESDYVKVNVLVYYNLNLFLSSFFISWLNNLH